MRTIRQGWIRKPLVVIAGAVFLLLAAIIGAVSGALGAMLEVWETMIVPAWAGPSKTTEVER